MKVIEESKAVWRHHFGMRVIDGKEYKSQDKEDDEKIMIERDDFTKVRLISLQKQYRDLEYESRRVLKRKNFPQQDQVMKKVLDTPLNLLKVVMWRNMRVGEVKQRVWLSMGEEILSRSGILSWQEDLEHLQNQLTVDQPGSCDSKDMKQAKRDARKLKEDMNFEEKRKDVSKRKN